MNVSRKVNESMIDMLKNFSKTSSPRYLLDKYEYYSVNPNGGEEDMKKASLLGKGGFGDVYSVREIKARDPYAVKIVKMNYEENYSSGHATTISEMDQNRIFMFVKYCQEACLLSGFCHSNIVKVRETWIQMGEEGSGNEGEAERFESEALANIQIILNFLLESGESGRAASTLSGNVAEALERTQGLTLYMVMDLYDTDLAQYACSLKNETKVEIIKDLIKAIDYLHSKHYCHLDLKPSNILLQTSNNEVKVAVADFGLCTRFRPEAIPREPGAGTWPYNTAQTQMFLIRLTSGPLD
ncbi:eukaryotic translation initiation factor 2-alpha kinase 1-like [Watersipora subatra]|uniref:eukaryotic translation initiation factor 2-alpha kinase 1-like n=1 Tax=Watersipora subatra TaxID=2589382 RepID=UPI00355C89AD